MTFTAEPMVQSIPATGHKFHVDNIENGKLQKTSCLSHPTDCFSSSWNQWPGSGCSVLFTLEGTPRKEHFYPNISHHVYRELWALLSPHSRQNIISIFLNWNWILGQWYGSVGKGAHCQAQQPEFHSQDPYGGRRKEQIPTECAMTFTYTP